MIDLGLPDGMTMMEYYNLPPLVKLKLDRNKQACGTKGRVLQAAEREAINAATVTAYYHDTYGQVAWDVAITDLADLGYSDKQIIWILNSKYARWASDQFRRTEAAGEWDEDEQEFTDEVELPLSGHELRQYHEKWGIELSMGMEDI